MDTKAIVQGMYAAATRGDLQAFFAAAADDIVVHEPSFMPFGGTYQGKTGFEEMLTKAAGFLDVFSLTVDHMIVDGDRAFVLFRVRTLDQQAELTVGEESLVRDGKIVDLRIFIHEGGPLVRAI